MNVRLSALLTLHGAVLLFALAGLFAKWVALDAFWLVLGRTGFAALALFAWLLIFNQSALHVRRVDSNRFLLSGFLLFVHWLTFFAAIQVSSVTFGLLVFASFPVFTLLCQSLVEQRLPKLSQIVQAVIIVFGVMLLTLDANNNQASYQALIYGLVSAATFAGLLFVNKSLVCHYQATTVAFYQNSTAFLCTLPLIYFYQQSLVEITQQLPMLILLGVVFTALSHSLLNHALEKLTAFAVGIAICLEPIYGAAAAMIVLGEQPGLMMVIGGMLIVLVNGFAALTSNH